MHREVMREDQLVRQVGLVELAVLVEPALSLALRGARAALKPRALEFT